MGSVQSIVIRPVKRGEPKRITEANIFVGGIEGDLIRPLIDPVDTRITISTGCRILLGETITSMDLQHLINDKIQAL